jgi:porphobilinogen deaminase
VLELEGVLAYPDGREKIHFMVKGLPGQEKELGGTLAQEILKAGGREILQELHLL